MVAYQDEKDGIYALQRRDAVAALDKVDVRSIRLVISPVLIILLACSLCLSVSMAVLNVKTGGTHTSLVTPIDPDPDVTEPEPFVEQVYYTVTYRVVYTTDGMSFVDNIGGYVTGGNTQEVKAGEDALTVTAVADEGFGFVAWMDTLYDDTQKSSRTDKAINEDVEYVAIFMLSDNGSGGSGNGNGSGGGGDGSGNSGSSNGSGGGASVDFKENNKVIEGDTYYRDIIDAYYEQAMQQLADGTLSDEMRAFIEQYYGIIQ
jgi:uncharacterized membrane protein YgcG